MRRMAYFLASAVTAALASTAVGTPATAAESISTTGASGTQFGAVVAKRGTETFAQAQQRADTTYGGLPISRVFYSGAPPAWPGNAGYSGRDVVVSFKYVPEQVIAGTYDRAIRSWFANAPTDRDIYWSYFHEPEDNIEAGETTAANYRAAFAHVAALAALANNPRLHATLILMCWTLGPASGRHWHNYYAGPASVEDVAFDCYNYAGRSGSYVDPSKLFSRVVQFGINTGIPWGIAEVGSIKINSDTTGDGRAAWLRSVGQFLAGKAIFANYFDVKLSTDYRLLDAPSEAAWREVVTTY